MNLTMKGVGLNPPSQIHYTDHLAVVCILMNIPLLFVEEHDQELGEKLYPGLQSLRVEFLDLTIESLIHEYDVLFISDLWDRNEFHQRYGELEASHNKRMRLVHCPHGFSDKGFYLSKCANEDITLVYGQNMLDQFKQYGVFNNLNKYVISGNYRYTYFKQHREFYDHIMKSEILNRFAVQRPIILYAPTWLDYEESTTFFESTEHLLDHLPSEYNMIVKLHPRLELDDIAGYYQLIGKYEKKENILFLSDFPAVYPILNYADIYIGDMSAVGYDFLIFNRPMFFLKKSPEDSQRYLHRCGIEIQPADLSNIYQIIAKNVPSDQQRFGEIRKETYAYTFGEERPFAAIKQDIINAYSS